MAAASSRRVGTGAALVVVLVIAVLALSKSNHLHIALPQIGSGCVAHGRGIDIPLNTDQAAIAATIAGVARHRAMPVRAVTIAYAAALQESDLENLPYGDRDSVGVFQQRPSQGWGTRRQLLDPVYATSKFFGALSRVRGYRRLFVYQAAQAVQHSADGQAYSQYAPQGAAMAAGFTGELPHAVWCWYGDGISGRSKLADARVQLSRAFGGLQVTNVGDPTAQVRVNRPAAGWSIASWLVTHASQFNIKTVSYDGYRWTAAHGQRGWARYPATASHGAKSRGVRNRGTQGGTGRERAAARLAVSFG